MFLISRSSINLCVLIVCALVAGPSWGFSHKPQKPAPVPGKVLVSFHEGVDSKRIATIVESEGGTVTSVLASTGVHIIVLPEGVDVSDAVDRFSAYEEVRYAEPAQKALPLEEK